MNKAELVKEVLNKLRKNDTSVETDTIDIKGEWYSNTDKPKNEWRDDLLKDVCAFANNSNGKAGHLIFGLKETSPHLNSILIKEDEATIQQIVSANINPVPKIALGRVTVENSHTYILSITGEILSLPYFAKLSDGNHRIYIRRGSSINQCRKEDLDKMLSAMRDKRLDLRLEAPAIKAVRDINHKLKTSDGKDFLDLLNALDQYTYGYNFKVYREVLNTIYDIERYLAFERDKDVTQIFFQIFQNCLQTHSLSCPLNRKIPIQHINLLENGTHINREVCFNALKKYDSSKVFGEAVYTLRRILRFTYLNNLEEIQDQALDIFDELKKYTKETENEDSLAWIEFQRKDALALNGEDLPQFPSNLIDKFGI